MDIYLASPAGDTFFFEAVAEAVDAIKKVHGEAWFRLVHPPRKLPKDLGQVDLNFAQLLGSDVVILNISPETVDARDLYNPGVMEEYGMVFASDRGTWQSRWPRPVHKVFCHDSFLRTNLTPPLGIESVESYSRTPEGRKSIVRSVVELLSDRVKVRLLESATIGPPPYGGAYTGNWSIVSVSGLVTGK